MRRFLVLAALAVGCSVFAGTASSTVILKCIPNVRPGTEVVDKVTLRIFCGSAKATIKTSSATYKRSNGGCFRVAGSLIVGLGKYTTSVLHAPLYPSAFIVVPADKDGTYRLGGVTLQSKGKNMVASKVRVVVSGKRTRATFSGKFASGPKFTGSFTCK